MSSDYYGSISTKCFECGKNCFKLTRMQEGQVLAECINCGHAHFIDSVLEKKSKSPCVYWFSAPKKISRCFECRAELKIWDVSYDGKSAQSKCIKCGLIHTFKKPRFRGWQLYRVIRRVGEQVTDVQTALDLTQIKGVGTKTAETLESAGINNVSELANCSLQVLTAKTGISEKNLTKWIDQAKELTK